MENLLSPNLMFTLLAHGTLGDYDEEVFVAVVGIFLILMMYSWVRTHAIEPDLPNQHEKSDTVEQEHNPDHLHLD